MCMFEVSSQEEGYCLKNRTKDMQAMHTLPLFLTVSFYLMAMHTLPLLLTYKILPDAQPSGSLGFWLVPNSHLV